MTSQKTQRKTKISPDTESKREEPSDDWGKIVRNTVDHFYNRGWVQNLIIGLVLFFLGPTLGYIVNTKLGVIYGGAAGITLIVWIVAFTLASEATKAAKALPQPAIANTVTPPPAPKPLDMRPSDIIAQAVADRQSQVSTGGSGGIWPDFGSAYENQYVEWTLYLRSVRQSSGGEGDLEVRCAENKDSSDSETSVILYTDSTSHDFLRVSIDREQTFKVTGTIEKIGTSEIWLQGGDIQPISATGL